MALYAMNLDGSMHQRLVYSRPDVDLRSLVRIGRRNRVVGVAYSTDLPHAEYFDEDVKDLFNQLHQAMPQKKLMGVVDSNADESKFLVYAGSDNDPGAYYILDRKSHSLRKFFDARAKLQGVTLARVRSVTFTSTDGKTIPAYLTLPPGTDDPHGQPAIVMPHGGPSERDQWGFDWLAQYFAARGYLVLQPEFGGSAGLADDWFQQNGFKSWQTAVGEVVAAGHWLVSQGMADPSKLGIVGWSYGGYAALQSVAVDPTVFKAIVAVAPVTDLAAARNEHGLWSDFYQVSDFMGPGETAGDGSPVTHVDKFKQPVLIFHGTADRNVSVEESRKMDAALKAAGVKSELVTFDDRDHQLEDSAVRADMLRQADAFLRRSFGMNP